MFRGNFPVSHRVVGGFGDTDWTGLTAPGATHAVGRGGRSGCIGCSVISVKPVCLGIDRLEFLFGVESAGVYVANLVRGVGSHGQFFLFTSSALDNDNAIPMAMAPGSKANGGVNVNVGRSGFHPNGHT